MSVYLIMQLEQLIPFYCLPDSPVQVYDHLVLWHFTFIPD